MLSYLQSSLIIGVGLGITGLTVWLLNRTWPTLHRKAYNDVIGWQFGVLGTTYAVVLGFMLSSVWNNYLVAAADVRSEATGDLDVFRSADNLPLPFSEQLRTLAIRYASTVQNDEWPTMAHQGNPNQGDVLIASMWVTAANARQSLPSQADNSAPVRAALRALQDRREQRLEQYRNRLPSIMWTVLMSGAVLVIVSSCLSGNEKVLLHGFHVLSISVVVLLALTALADLARPFEGGASITADAFEEALARMANAVNPVSYQLPPGAKTVK